MKHIERIDECITGGQLNTVKLFIVTLILL